MSALRQGILPKLRMPPEVLRRGINLWPPFLGAGVSVTRVSADYREVDVTLKLGPGYVVWDKCASIRYWKPGRGDVFAHFRLSAAAIPRARMATAHGARHEPTFRVQVVDRAGDVVAEVEKTLFIRRHAETPPAGPVRRHATRRRVGEGIIAR